MPSLIIQGKPPDKRVWLKAGDEIACGLEKIGELRFALTEGRPREHAAAGPS